MTKKLLIIDTHYLAYRSFYGLAANNFISPNGQPTNAVFGFAKSFFNIFDQIQPTHIGVAYDKTKTTFRHSQYPEYKADRRPTPDDLRSQFPLIYDLLDALSIPKIGIENYEADDVIATLSTIAKKEKILAYIVSGDRDTFQLVDKYVTVLQPQKNSSDLKFMTPEAIYEKYKVTPAQYPDLAAIVGETSDNILGVQGVGPVGAAKLINQYGSLDNILQNASNINSRTGKALAESVEKVKLNRVINRLVDDIDLKIDFDSLKIKSPSLNKTLELYNKLGFGKSIRINFAQFAKTIDPNLDVSDFAGAGTLLSSNSSGNLKANSNSKTYYSTNGAKSDDFELSEDQGTLF
ncbi:MAG: hypothetical protein LBT85_02825 [Bifidobacteriaceae bacterium]|jgi:DNA polymerase-1|nr:hypothetical protein [Bifidobacteriaceae bacterium]